MDPIQLRSLSADLANAAKTLESISASSNTSSIFAARQTLCDISDRLNTFATDPNSFLYHLAFQTQVLACIKWLDDFQIVACIPLTGSIALDELASLTDASPMLLSRVVRMMATAGFLQELEPGLVAHTALSKVCTTELSCLDAVTFLANKIGPSGFQLMRAQNQRLHVDQQLDWYDANGAPIFAVATPHSFPVDQESQSLRQWSAFCRSMGQTENELSPLLESFQSLGQATVVHMCPLSYDLTPAFARIAPALRVIVQAYGPIPQEIYSPTAPIRRTLLQRRKPFTIQSIRDAAVYIIQPDLSPSSLNGSTLKDLLTGEIQSHLHMLRENPSAMLIVAPPLLPEPGSVPLQIESRARLRDFSQLQSTGHGALELSELQSIISNIGDGFGGLTVTSKLRSTQGCVVALALKYQPSTEGTGESNVSWDWNTFDTVC